jgi:hypothetical protein
MKEGTPKHEVKKEMQGGGGPKDHASDISKGQQTAEARGPEREWGERKGQVRGISVHKPRLRALTLVPLANAGHLAPPSG